jgi:O-antigen/teichoic acid export membrane protein
MVALVEHPNPGGCMSTGRFLKESVATRPVATDESGAIAEIRRQAVRGGGILLAARLFAQVITWGVTILVARYLTPYDYGVLTTAGIFLGLCDLLAEAGIGMALVQRKELGRTDIADGFTLSLVVSLVLYALLLPIAGPVSLFFRNPDVSGYLTLAGLLLVLIPFRTIPLALLERRLQMGAQATIHLGAALAQSVLTLVMAHRGWGYWSLLGGTAAARLLEAAMLAVRAGWTPRLGWPGLGSRSILLFGMNVSAASLLWYLYSNADFAVVGKLLGPSELGYYSLAFGLMSLPVQKLTANVNKVAYPVFCRLQHDRARLRQWYLKLVTLLGLIAVPAMLGLSLVARDAIHVVLGAKWSPAVLPLQALSLVGALMVFGSSLPPLINALGRPDVNMKYTLVCNLVYPASFIVLGLRYGVPGICASWLILYPIIMFLFIKTTESITGVSPADLLRTQREVLWAACGMTLLVTLTQWTLGSAGPQIRLACTVAVGVISYTSGLCLLGRSTIASCVEVVRASWREGRD